MQVDWILVILYWGRIGIGFLSRFDFNEFAHMDFDPNSLSHVCFNLVKSTRWWPLRHNGVITLYSDLFVSAGLKNTAIHAKIAHILFIIIDCY
jgi:hypothetical protein